MPALLNSRPDRPLISGDHPAGFADRHFLPRGKRDMARKLKHLCAAPKSYRLLTASLFALAIALTSNSGHAETPVQPRSNLYGIFDVPADRRAFSALNQLGVGWVRQQWQMGDDRSARKLNILVESLPKLVRRGIGLWLTVYHRDRDNLDDHGTISRTPGAAAFRLRTPPVPLPGAAGRSAASPRGRDSLDQRITRSLAGGPDQ